MCVHTYILYSCMIIAVGGGVGEQKELMINTIWKKYQKEVAARADSFMTALRGVYVVIKRRRYINKKKKTLLRRRWVREGRRIRDWPAIKPNVYIAASRIYMKKKSLVAAPFAKGTSHALIYFIDLRRGFFTHCVTLARKEFHFPLELSR